MQKGTRMRDLKRKFLRLFSSGWPVFLVIFITLIFFWKVTIKNEVPIPGDFVVGVYYPWLDYKWGYAVGVPVKNPLTTDVVSFTYPMQTLAIDLLKKWQAPLWNPLILAGSPLLANFQSAPFSPTNFVYFLFDKLSAWSLQIILQHVLAAFFTYILLRHWKVSKVGSLLGGLIFAFSGFNLIWSQWNGHTLAAAFIPLILFFEDRYLLNGRWFDGIGISLSFALLFLSGYPQVAMYLLIAVVLLWIVRIWKDKKWFTKTVTISIFFILGIGIAAFQILPGAELLSLSQRAVEPHPFEWAFLPWSKIITFFAPDYFGNHSTQNYWGPQDYTSNTGFVGVVATIFSLIAVKLIKKRTEVLYCFIVMIVSLMFAFPTPISIYLWESGLLGLNAASAHRSLVLFNLAVGLLAGFGVDAFLKKKVKMAFPLFIPFMILIVFLAYALLSPGEEIVRGIDKYKVALRNLIFPGAVFVASAIMLWISKARSERMKKVTIYLILAMTVFELFRFGWKFTPFSPRYIVFPTTPVIEFLQKQEKPVRVTGSRVIPINMRMPYELESLEGYDAVYPLRISQFIAAINSGKSGTDPVGRYGTVDNITSPLMDLVNTKYYLAIKRNAKGDPDPNGKIPDIFDPRRFKVAFEDKSVAVLESKSVLPRAFMVYDWEVEANDRAILDKLLSKDFPLSRKIIIEEPLLIGHTNPKVTGEVRYSSYQQQESIINVNTQTSGLLFVSDTWYPGWKAYVDGAETKIYRADFAFRAVPIPAGTHEVQMIYRPDFFYSGLKISGLSAFFLLVYFLGKYKWGRYTSNRDVPN